MIHSHDRQLALINSLLETQANEMEGLSLHLQPVNLHQFVEQLAADWEPLLHQEEAILNLLIPDDLPPVQGDPNQLCRVYENLIANALKHNPPGLTLTLRAEVIQDAKPPKVRCLVQDNGIGISPEHTNTIFELYKRGNQTRRTAGLGLGLYLCRQIITAHGGEIGVESQPHKGATFWFTLPIASEPQNLSKESCRT
jgi:two-component system sensor histidine kinase/response regulator